MAKPFVPFPLILQQTFAQGRRLPKLERFEIPKVVETKSVTFHPAGSVGTRRLPAGASTLVLVNNRWGNMRNDEYRYFIGVSMSDCNYSRCRACGGVCRTEDERVQHLLASNCKDLIHRAQRRSRQSRRCINCSAPFFREKWGTYFCSEERCEFAWRIMGCDDFALLIKTIKSEETFSNGKVVTNA